MGPLGRRRHVRVVAGMAAAWMVAGGLSLASAGTVGAAGATVAVDESRTTGPLLADAVGLSYESADLGRGQFDAGFGNEAQMLKTMGAHNVRIGGNTLDAGTFWDPNGAPMPTWAQWTNTPADLTRLRAFLDAVNARVELGVNLAHVDGPSINNETGSAISILGSDLYSIECGNEPNDFSGHGLRPAGYGYPQFLVDFKTCAAAVNGRVGIAGPDTTGAWITQLATDESPVMNQLTNHRYPNAPDTTTMLSASADAADLSFISPLVAAAHSHNLVMRSTETNSHSNGGLDGTSNRYASALWAFNYTLNLTQAGDAGVDLHGYFGQCPPAQEPGPANMIMRYSPLCATTAADAAAHIDTAQPLFYGLWMAGHMGPGQFFPVTVSTGGANLTAYAVKGDDGLVRIALIDKDAVGSSVNVTVNAGSGSGTAQVVRMTGPSLAAATGVQIQGASVDRSGVLNVVPDSVAYSGGSLTLSLGTGTAAILTLGSPHHSGPPGPATGVTGAPAGAGQVGLGWTPPADNGGAAITAYAVYAFSYTASPTMLETTNPTSMVATGLASGSYYTFTLSAWNGVGWGGWSNWSPWVLVG